MRTLSTLAVVLVALAASRAGEKIAAPVPKDKPALAIEGKYTLLSVTTQTVAFGPGGPGGPGGGPAAAGFGGARVNVSPFLVGPATITKNEILLEGSGRVAPLAGIGGSTTMEYTIDSTKTPAFIDVDIVNIRGKKSKSLGLVEVNGNRLILALAKEGEERPKSTEEADGVTVYYFQKSPPPPRTEFRIVAMTAGKEEAAEKELNKLAQEGFEFVSTTQPVAADAKSSVTTVHFLLKRTVK
jgi:hypothetical protein